MKIFETLKQLLGLGQKKSEEMTDQSNFFRKMAVALEHTRDEEFACDETYELLDQFAEAVQRGDDAASLMPLVQHHIDMCPECREEFEVLLRILEDSPAPTQ